MPCQWSRSAGCGFVQALSEQVALLSRLSQDSQVRIEQLSSRLREADSIVAELASTKRQLGSTTALLRDARTELKVATMTGAYALPSTRALDARSSNDPFPTRTRAGVDMSTITSMSAAQEGT